MRDYYAESLKICSGESLMLPERGHLMALLTRLESERRQDDFALEMEADAAFEKWVEERAYERGEPFAEEHGDERRGPSFDEQGHSTLW